MEGVNTQGSLMTQWMIDMDDITKHPEYNKTTRTMVVALGTALVSTWMVGAVAVWFLLSSHTDHPQLHSNGFNRIVDNFVSKDHFEDVVDQINQRIEDLKDVEG